MFFYEIHKIINDLVNRDMVNPEHESFIFDREILGPFMIPLKII